MPGWHTLWMDGWIDGCVGRSCSLHACSCVATFGWYLRSYGILITGVAIIDWYSMSNG